MFKPKGWSDGAVSDELAAPAWVQSQELKLKKIVIIWVRWLTCNPSAEKGETGAPCRPLASQSSRISELCAHEMTYLRNKAGWWKDSLATESTHCSCRGLEFSPSHQSWWLSAACNSNCRRSTAPFWTLQEPAFLCAQTHRRTHAYEHH